MTPVFSRTGFVYLWTNKENGKQHIGSHIGTPDDGYVGSGVLFRKALKKYGIEKFSRNLLETDLPEAEVKVREQHYLDIFDAAASKMFYNVAKTAGTYIGHSDVTRKQMSEKIKRSLTKVKGRVVHCFSVDGVLMCRYDSISEAARQVGGKPSNIKYTCEGKFKSAYGFLWSYSDICPSNDFYLTRSNKRAETPLGNFSTIKAASEKLLINPLTLKRRIWKGTPGYRWDQG